MAWRVQKGRQTQPRIFMKWTLDEWMPPFGEEVLLLVLGFCLVVLPQTGRGADVGFTGKDQEFLQKAAQAGMAEVELGKLAADKGSTAAIRDFGAMMVKDHTMLNNEVKELARGKNVTLPTVMDAKRREKLDELAKKSGKDFDEAYLDCMKKAHKEDLDLFENARDKTKDPDVKAAADKALPIIKTHAEHLKTLS
jgi:putative membrane protein